VAVGADFLVDLVAALQLLAIKGAERAFKGEADALGRLLAFGGERRAACEQQSGECE
jgi:hypothetical protein